MKKSCLKRLFKTMQNTPNLAEAIAEDNKEFVLDKQTPFDRENRVNASDLLSKQKKDEQDGDVIDVAAEEPKE